MEHKLITGGEQYLPFARSRIKALKATGLSYASQKFEVDGVSIRVRYDMQHEYIEISGGDTISYEFMSPGGQFARESYLGFVVPRMYGVKVAVNGTSINAIPSGSTVEQPTPTGKQWGYSANVGDAYQFSPHKQYWQVQHIVESAYYASIPNPNTDIGGRVLNTKRTLTNSWCSSSQIANLRQNAPKEIDLNGIKYRKPAIFDVQYDIAPALFEKKQIQPVKEAQLAPDADWYKSAAYRVVDHPEFGSRTFIILNDISQKFHAYPIVDPDPTLNDSSPYLSQLIKTNIPSQYVKTVDAPLPAWARKVTSTLPDKSARAWLASGGGTGTYYRRHFPQYKWAYNSTATKAVCIVFKDYAPFVYPSNYFDPPQAGVTYQAIYPGVANEAILTYQASHESSPGLAEIGIDIQLTGLNPEDFSFTLTSGLTINPDTDNKYIIAADYSWGKKPGGAENGTTLDDLIVMTLEHYPQTDGVAMPDPNFATNQYNEQTNITVQNLTQNTEVKKFTQSRHHLESGVANRLYWMRFLACDLRTLAFMTEAIYRRTVTNSPFPIFQTTKTLQVSVYGVDEPPIRMGDSLGVQADMDAFIAPRTISSANLLSPAATMVTNGDMNLTWSTLTANERCAVRDDRAMEDFAVYERYSSVAIVSASAPPVLIREAQLGARQHGLRASGVMSCYPHSSFSIHPDGHWSVTAPMTLAYTGDLTGALSGADDPSILIDPSYIKQDFVDIISFNNPKTGIEKRTTHLAMFNKAYEKSVQKIDLHWPVTPYLNGYIARSPADPVNTWLNFYAGKADMARRTIAHWLDIDGTFIARGSSMFFK